MNYCLLLLLLLLLLLDSEQQAVGRVSHLDNPPKLSQIMSDGIPRGGRTSGCDLAHPSPWVLPDKGLLVT